MKLLKMQQKMIVPPACAYEDSCFCRAMCFLPMVKPPSTTRMAWSDGSDSNGLTSAALLAWMVEYF